jgi:hypothetical protein
MSRFLKQYRVLIAIFTVFLVLGIAPLVVMRFFPPEQSETAETELPEAETAEVSTEATVTEEYVVTESAVQRPFDRFLGTASSDETEKEETKENAENNVEKVEKETTDQLVSAQSILPLKPVFQPEKIVEIPVKPETVITTTPPGVQTDSIDKKNNDHSTSAKPEPVKLESVNKEPAKPKPVKKEEPSKLEPSKPELSKSESPKPELAKPEPIRQEPPKPQTNKIEATKTASDWIPFIYFYQRFPSGHQKITLFPLVPKSEPVVIETKIMPPTILIPVIQIQPVYTPIFVPIIYYPPYL